MGTGRHGDDDGAVDVFALQVEQAELVAAVSAGAVGIYLTETVVKERLGYPGRPALNVGDLDAQERELWAMAARDLERGFVWKHTPEQALVRD